MQFKKSKDNILAFILDTPLEILEEIRQKAKQRRLEQNLTQEGLAVRSGVSLGSIKRFERTGKISLKSLLDIALVIDALSDFKTIFEAPEPISLFNVKEPKKRQRGKIN